MIVGSNSCVPTGHVLRNAEANEDGYGTIPSEELNALESRVLLVLTLLRARSITGTQDVFFTY